MEKIPNNNQKKGRVVTLISNKRDFRTRNITRVKQGHFMTKDSILQETITILNVYVLKIRASKYIKQKLTELRRNWQVGK